MSEPTTLGFAVSVDGQIIVRTVSDTRRAAIVNWLVVERDHLITRNFTDADIEHVWAFETNSEVETLPEIKVVRVGITPAGDVDP